VADTSSETAWLFELIRSGRGRVGRREIDELRSSLIARTVERGQVLIKAGEIPTGLWIIRTGLVELVMGTNRRRRVVQLLREGDVLGDSFLALAVDSPYTARVVEKGRLLYLPAERFEALLEDYPALAVWWLSNALSRLAKTRVRIVEVLGKTLQERVARLLVDEAVNGSLHLPQKTLAEMLGVQRSSLNKILREFESSGLVEVGYSHVELKDGKRLKEVAAGERLVGEL
jgi:CRP/FNR family transcriptional regulator, cAMP and macrophage regulator